MIKEYVLFVDLVEIPIIGNQINNVNVKLDLHKIYQIMNALNANILVVSVLKVQKIVLNVLNLTRKES